MNVEFWGVDRCIEPDVLDCCRCDGNEVCGCDCHFRDKQPDADELYDRWRDAQDEAE